MKYIIKLNDKIISRRNTIKIYNFCALTTYKLDDISWNKTECSKDNILTNRHYNKNILFREIKEFPEPINGVRTLAFNNNNA